MTKARQEGGSAVCLLPVAGGSLDGLAREKGGGGQRQRPAGGNQIPA